MEIIHYQPEEKTYGFRIVKSTKTRDAILHTEEKELLKQVSSAFEIVHGGYFKSRYQLSA